MGFLRKAFKKVKKGIKKVARGIKKVVKKISKSKILKTIALVGAAIVTGGAAVGAFGGQLASSTMGTWLTTASSKILATPVIGTLAKPFQMLGTAVGTGAGKVTDFLGFTSEAGRLGSEALTYTPGVSETVSAKDVGKVYDVKTGKLLTGEQMAEIGLGSAPQTTSTGFFGTTAGQFVRDVGMSYVESKLQPEPEYPGEFIGYGSAPSPILDPLQVSFAQPAVNIGDAYSNLQFGTADPGYLAANLYRQETVGGMA
tara:strand:- start:334 stop:1101 length:768 start_codon:yes stop_codon:yes gene_type:complete